MILLSYGSRLNDDKIIGSLINFHACAPDYIKANTFAKDVEQSATLITFHTRMFYLHIIINQPTRLGVLFYANMISQP